MDVRKNENAGWKVTSSRWTSREQTPHSGSRQNDEQYERRRESEVLRTWPKAHSAQTATHSVPALLLQTQRALLELRDCRFQQIAASWQSNEFGSRLNSDALLYWRCLSVLFGALTSAGQLWQPFKSGQVSLLLKGRHAEPLASQWALCEQSLQTTDVFLRDRDRNTHRTRANNWLWMRVCWGLHCSLHRIYNLVKSGILNL